jgi:uncharacterized protein (TIGR02611 family)
MHSFGTLMRFIWRSGKRAAVFVVGAGLLTVGLIMFVTPGPGIVLVVAGLAVLATEFAWAEHLLDKAKEQAARAGQSAQRLPGVAKVTATAGRLVPRRWRRATVTAVEADQATAGSEPPTAGPADAGAQDAGEPHAEPPTAGPADAGEPDAEAPDAGAPDAARGIGQRHTSGQRRVRRHRDHEPR